LEGPRLERLVLVSGTSGVGLRGLYKLASSHPRFQGCVVDFERELLSPAALPGGYSIVYLVTLAGISRPQVVRLFKRAARRVVERLAGAGCGRGLVFAHLSYIVGGNIFPNPVVGDILGYADRRALVYFMDDYYDAVTRIVSKVGDPQQEPMVTYRGADVEHVDPLSYLEWRGYDLNQLGLLEARDPELEIHIVGSKHPMEAVERLLFKVYGEREYRTVYVSHPISFQRFLYSRLPYRYIRGASLGGMPLVSVIEAFKEALLGVDDLIPYSPTTIDEYVLTNARLYYEDRFMCPEVMADCGDPPSLEALEERAVPSLFWLRRRDRWPVPKGSMTRFLEGRDPPEEVDLTKASIRTRLLRGRSPHEEAPSAWAFEVCQEWMLLGQALDEEDYHSTLALRMLTLIRHQIEARDYQYVAQSDSTIAVIPVLVVSEEAAGRLEAVRPGLYLVPSTGMDAEIARAKALGKPVQVVLLPVCYEALYDWLHQAAPDRADGLAAQALRGMRWCSGTGGAYDACSRRGPVERLEPGRDDELLDDMYRCMAGLVRGRVFGTLRGGVAPCFSRVLLARNGGYEELVSGYRGSMGACLSK